MIGQQFFIDLLSERLEELRTSRQNHEEVWSVVLTQQNVIPLTSPAVRTIYNRVWIRNLCLN